MNAQNNDHQQKRNALRHCKRIKSVYRKCRQKRHLIDNYTHIPLELWEVIEAMLEDDTITEKENP